LPTQPAFIKQNVTVSKPKLPQNQNIYIPYNLAPIGSTQDEFYQLSSTKIIADQIQKVVNSEGPISHNLLCKRIIKAWGMSKVGSRIDARISEICASSKLQTTKLGTMKYYWPANLNPNTYKGFRVPNSDKQSRRDVEDIPLEEIKNAATEILVQQISLPKEDLIREAARLLGFQRTRPTIQEYFIRGIDLLIKSGTAVNNDNYIVVKN
jgi:Protein of unknown function (DUF3320).